MPPKPNNNGNQTPSPQQMFGANNSYPRSVQFTYDAIVARQQQQREIAQNNNAAGPNMIAAQGANGMINNVQGPIQAAQQPPQNNALAVGNAQNPIVVAQVGANPAQPIQAQGAQLNQQEQPVQPPANNEEQKIGENPPVVQVAERDMILFQESIKRQRISDQEKYCTAPMTDEAMEVCFSGDWDQFRDFFEVKSLKMVQSLQGDFILQVGGKFKKLFISVNCFFNFEVALGLDLPIATLVFNTLRFDFMYMQIYPTEMELMELIYKKHNLPMLPRNFRPTIIQGTTDQIPFTVLIESRSPPDGPEFTDEILARVMQHFQDPHNQPLDFKNKIIYCKLPNIFNPYVVPEIMPCIVNGHNLDSEEVFSLPLHSLERIWGDYTLFNHASKAQLSLVQKFMSLVNQLFGFNIYNEVQMGAQMMGIYYPIQKFSVVSAINTKYETFKLMLGDMRDVLFINDFQFIQFVQVASGTSRDIGNTPPNVIAALLTLNSINIIKAASMDFLDQKQIQTIYQEILQAREDYDIFEDTFVLEINCIVTSKEISSYQVIKVVRDKDGNISLVTFLRDDSMKIISSATVDKVLKKDDLLKLFIPKILIEQVSSVNVWQPAKDFGLPDSVKRQMSRKYTHLLHWGYQGQATENYRRKTAVDALNQMGNYLSHLTEMRRQPPPMIPQVIMGEPEDQDQSSLAERIVNPDLYLFEGQFLPLDKIHDLLVTKWCLSILDDGDYDLLNGEAVMACKLLFLLLYSELVLLSKHVTAVQRRLANTHEYQREARQTQVVINAQMAGPQYIPCEQDQHELDMSIKEYRVLRIERTILKNVMGALRYKLKLACDQVYALGMDYETNVYAVDREAIRANKLRLYNSGIAGMRILEKVPKQAITSNPQSQPSDNGGNSVQDLQEIDGSLELGIQLATHTAQEQLNQPQNIDIPNAQEEFKVDMVIVSDDSQSYVEKERDSQHAHIKAQMKQDNEVKRVLRLVPPALQNVSQEINGGQPVINPPQQPPQMMNAQQARENQQAKFQQVVNQQQQQDKLVTGVSQVLFNQNQNPLMRSEQMLFQQRIQNQRAQEQQNRQQSRQQQDTLMRSPLSINPMSIDTSSSSNSFSNTPSRQLVNNFNSSQMIDMLGSSHSNSQSNSGRASVNTNSRVDSVEDDLISYAEVLTNGTVCLNPSRSGNLVLIDLTTGKVFVKSSTYSKDRRLNEVKLDGNVDRVRYVKRGIEYILGLVTTDSAFLYHLRQYGIRCREKGKSNVPAPFQGQPFPEFSSLPNDTVTKK